jgi:hypothetical protein
MDEFDNLCNCNGDEVDGYVTFSMSKTKTKLEFSCSELEQWQAVVMVMDYVTAITVTITINGQLLRNSPAYLEVIPSPRCAPGSWSTNGLEV